MTRVHQALEMDYKKNIVLGLQYKLIAHPSGETGGSTLGERQYN